MVSDGSDFETAVLRLRAAAEPTRLRILRLLQATEFNIKDLTHVLGQSQPRVSRHIKLLADVGLIERHQEGSWVFLRSTTKPGIARFVTEILAMVAEHDPQSVRDIQRANQIRRKRIETAEAYFDANADAWDRIRSRYIPEQAVEAALLAALGPGLVDLLLDLGTGTGRILELAAHTAKRLIGVDANRGMLNVARARLDRSGFTHCSVRLGDIYDLPFSDGVADTIILHQVLHYLDQPKAAVAEAVRVLRQHGKLIVVDFAPHDLEFLRDSHAHVRLGFHEAEVCEWLRGFGLETCPSRTIAAQDHLDGALTVTIWSASKQQAAVDEPWRVAS